ncbi:hypothetical protein ACOME3_010496 [Neoechinorhynchus agilis]
MRNQSKFPVFLFDYHSGEVLPKRWINRGFILRCDTAVIFDRLEARGYSNDKIQENVQCEIYGIVTEECTNKFKDRVIEIRSDTLAMLESNVNDISSWIKNVTSKNNKIGNK